MSIDAMASVLQPCDGGHRRFANVLRHVGLADIHAELNEFTMDGGSAP
jgi:hypothetical protein